MASTNEDLSARPFNWVVVSPSSSRRAFQGQSIALASNFLASLFVFKKEIFDPFLGKCSKHVPQRAHVLPCLHLNLSSQSLYCQIASVYPIYRLPASVPLCSCSPRSFLRMLWFSPCSVRLRCSLSGVEWAHSLWCPTGEVESDKSPASFPAR